MYTAGIIFSGHFTNLKVSDICSDWVNLTWDEEASDVNITCNETVMNTVFTKTSYKISVAKFQFPGTTYNCTITDVSNSISSNPIIFTPGRKGVNILYQ